MIITATTLYNYLKCPHRVWRDVYGPKDELIEESNPFIELLWKRGVLHEEKTIHCIGEFLDLSEGSYDERFEQTKQAMDRKVPLIYQGLLKHENLLGIPDLLLLQPDNRYIPVDIKSGMAFEGSDEDTGDEGKPKKHYAVQLCLYSDLLQKLGYSSRSIGKIIDIGGNEVFYDLNAPMGVRTKETYWECYERVKKHVEFLMKNEDKNNPAMSGDCKMCPWYSSCKAWCEEHRDLSNLFYVGRSARDTISNDLFIDTMEDLLEVDVEHAMKEKKKDKEFLKGIGEKTLTKMVTRADILLNTKEPVRYATIQFPKVSYELFFDIEDDPTQEFAYLHGVYERGPEGERFLDFTAKEISEEAEKKALSDFWDYIHSLPEDDFSVYYYSAHEKTTYRKLQRKYPDVITEEEVDAFFENPNVIDLYKIVLKDTDWPLGSYSLKAIAMYLGFKWRDETPSGALSIQWFNEYIETGDESILERILLYNEDDCKATMVMKDALEKL